MTSKTNTLKSILILKNIMKSSLILIFVVLACGYVSADSGNVYCGRRLANVLAALCYDSENMVKRNVGWWILPANARALGGGRDKRGLVDECCFKSCTRDELISYC